MAESDPWAYSESSAEVSFMEWPMCVCVLAPTEGAGQQVLEKYCCSISGSV